MGYVLRLSETNGYASPWNLFQLAGMRQNETRTTGIKVKKLAMIANHSPSQFEKLAFSPSTAHPRWAGLLGHPVVPTDIEITKPKLCPQCVAEKGFVEAHWHLEIMVACPVHRCMALSACPKCGNALSWFRPGLLECRCRGSLADPPPGVVSEATASLLDVVRRKVLGLPMNEDNPELLPMDGLRSLNLRTLLSVIRILARHRMDTDGATGSKNNERVISEASRVLMHWPSNFSQLLSDIGKSISATGPTGVGAQFAPIYKALFKSRAIAPREQVEFMKLAFLDFAINHWGRGYVDGRLANQSGAQLSGRYLTRAQVAVRAGIQPRTVTRLIKSLNLCTTAVGSTTGGRILIDAHQTTIPFRSPGKIYRDREAARSLGLPVSVLKGLKIAGLYEVNHLLPKQPGFHERDVEVFNQKLLALAPDRTTLHFQSATQTTLQAAMRSHHQSLDTKMGVMSAILRGDVAVTTGIDGAAGSLLLDGPRYQECVKACQNGATLTAVEAAIALGCDRGTIPELVRRGLLKGAKSSLSLRVESESAECFRKRYVSLASVAAEQRTSSRALVCRFRKEGVKMLFVSSTRRGGPQPFMLLSNRKLEAGTAVERRPGSYGTQHTRAQVHMRHPKPFGVKKTVLTAPQHAQSSRSVLKTSSFIEELSR